MRKAIIESVRDFLFEELSKRYSCTKGSNLQDLSYINFSEMIRIEIPAERHAFSGDIIHVNVRWSSLLETPIVEIYFSHNNMSYKFVERAVVGDSKTPFAVGSFGVDIAAPDFGKLLEVTVKYIEGAFNMARTPPPVIND